MPVVEIDVEALDRMAPTTVQLIDVREPDEYVAARVPGARLIPLAAVPAAIDQLDPSRPVYVICATGGRSLHAAAWLETQGFEAINIAGGTKAWVTSGRVFDSGPTSGS